MAQNETLEEMRDRHRAIRANIERICLARDKMQPAIDDLSARVEKLLGSNQTLTSQCRVNPPPKK